jgi:hypothetical protein
MNSIWKEVLPVALGWQLSKTGEGQEVRQPRATDDTKNQSSDIYFIHANIPGKMKEVRKVVLIR